MQDVSHPAISIDQAATKLDRETFQRDADYARKGWVLQCQWSPDAGTLFGTVRGNKLRPYTVLVKLSRGPAGGWAVASGRCTCPMSVNCKHVAALVVAAHGSRRVPPPSNRWRRFTDETMFALIDSVRR